MTTPAHEQAELLSLAVHEFRTPVTVVAGYTKMLVNEQLGPVSERQRKVLLDIEQQCGRLSRLLKEMSELAELVNPDTPPLAAGRDRAERRCSMKPPAASRAGEWRRSAGANGTAGPADSRGRPQAAALRARCGDQGSRARAGRGRACGRGRGERGSTRTALRGHRGRPRGHPSAAGTTAAPMRRFNEYPGGIGLGLPIARRVIEQAGGRVWSTEQERRLGVVTILLPLKESLS